MLPPTYGSRRVTTTNQKLLGGLVNEVYSVMIDEDEESTPVPNTVSQIARMASPVYDSHFFPSKENECMGIFSNELIGKGSNISSAHRQNTLTERKVTLQAVFPTSINISPVPMRRNYYLIVLWLRTLQRVAHYL